MFCFLCLCLFLALVAVGMKRRPAGGPREPPCLPALPVIGSLLSLCGSRPPHVLFMELQEKYGQTFSLMMGSHCVVVVNQHVHAREVLLKKSKMFAGRPRSVGKPRAALMPRFLCSPSSSSVMKVTTDVLTRDGKDIAFGDYSPTWRFHRKIVHGALYMFGEGCGSIERISE